MKANTVALIGFVTTLALSAGCARPGGRPAQKSGVQVLINKPASAVAPGGSLQLTAEVSGTANQALAWEVASGPGTVTREGLYAAPKEIEADPTHATLAATSVVSASATATVQVTISRTAAPPPMLAGYAGPKEIRALAQDMVTLAVDGAALATRLERSQTLVQTGTLTQKTPGKLDFSYSPAPKDRLVVAYTTGQEDEFTFRTVRGDLSGGSRSFFRDDHELEVKALIPPRGELDITSQEANRKTRRSMRGTAKIDGLDYDVNLTHSGATIFSSSGGVVEYQSQEGVSGTVARAGFALNVNESWRYINLADSRTVLENVIRNTNSAWMIGQTKYEFRVGLERKAFRDGKPSEVDTYWVASGDLLRNGQEYGKLGHGKDGQYYKFWLQLPDQRVELEKWRL